ncbi:MAG: ABC transporter permease [Trueperaceae bacterium]
MVFILRRLIQLIPTLAVIAVVAFFLIRVAGGDPTALLLPQDASQEDIQRMRRSMGLHQPLFLQFFYWMRDLLSGNLGISYYTRDTVVSTIIDRAYPTLWLAVSAQMVAIVIAVPAGIISAVRQNSWLDRLFTIFALGGVAIPNFWFAMMLVMVVSISLGWLPSQGFTDPLQDPWQGFRRLVLPSVALGYLQAGLITRMTRSAMLDVLRLDYVRTARAKGLRETAIVGRHALSNAMNPILTVIGISMASLFTGAVVTELVFNFPGLGQLIVEAVGRRDFPLIQGVLVILAVITLLINFFIDISYGLFDPRIRYD